MFDFFVLTILNLSPMQISVCLPEYGASECKMVHHNKTVKFLLPTAHATVSLSKDNRDFQSMKVPLKPGYTTRCKFWMDVFSCDFYDEF